MSDELSTIRELFDADDHALDDAAIARVLDRVDTELAVAADEGPPSAARASRHRRRMVLGPVAAAAAVIALVIVLLATSGAHRRDARPPARSSVKPTTPTTKAPQFAIAGYTVSEAQAATTQCLAEAHAFGQEHAALRATFKDTLGSLLVVTTPTGFYTCRESPDGTVDSSGGFHAYDPVPPPIPGVATPRQVSGDPRAHWLLDPVELDEAGGGYPSKAQTNIWVTTAIGRVAPDVAKVVIQLPNQPTQTATVENGFFVARQVFSSPPEIAQGPGTIPLRGYNRAGALVYNSLSSPTAITPGTPPTQVPKRPIPCWVTPTGQPVTLSSPGQHCRTAIAWGY